LLDSTTADEQRVEWWPLKPIAGSTFIGAFRDDGGDVQFVMHRAT
jgi:hypothetical protein